MSSVRSRWLKKYNAWRGIAARRRKRYIDNPTPENRALLSKARNMVSYALRVLRRHPPASGSVASPVKLISHAWGYHPGVHDGVDLICGAEAKIYALCDAEIVDVRTSGWWGKGAQASHGHPISDGDGIIQLKCLTDRGPFKKGMVFGYGHAEGPVVKVGQRVEAGQHIGHAGFANAWHVHFMANGGNKRRADGGYSGVGDRDPWAYVSYAMKGG